MKTSLAIVLIATAATAAPVVEQSRTMSNDTGQVTVVAVERANDPSGRPADWRQTVQVSTPVRPDLTEVTREVKERNARGEMEVVSRQTTTVRQVPGGTQSETTELTRDAAGRLKATRLSETTENKALDGTPQSNRLDKVPDINGNWQPARQDNRTTRVVSPTETVTENRIQTVDRLTGRFAVTSIETTRTQTDGARTLTETAVMRPNTVSELLAKTVTTATKGDDGSVRSETIEYGQSLGTSAGPSARGAELRPRVKVIESVVTNPDGTQTRQREVFHYNVNGEWQPAKVVPAY